MTAPLEHQHDCILEWASSITGGGRFSPVVSTPYSAVWQGHAGAAGTYLKFTPPGLDHEAPVLSILRERCRVQEVPAVIAHRPELQCFLMTSCGFMTVRSAFEQSGFDEGLASTVFGLYRRIQVASQAAQDELLSAGCHDWRITPNGDNPFEDLLDDAGYWLAHGVTDRELAALRRFRPNVRQACLGLHALGIPDSIGHADLHDGNALLATQGVRIVDWGESAVEHPVFSVLASVVRLCLRYGIEPGTIEHERLRHSAFDGFNLPPDGLDECLRHMEVLRPLYFALTFREVHRAAGANLMSIPRMRTRLREMMRPLLRIAR